MKVCCCEKGETLGCLLWVREKQAFVPHKTWPGKIAATLLEKTFPLEQFPRRSPTAN